MAWWRAAHSTIARTSGLRGPAPPHPSGDGLSVCATAQWRRPRESRASESTLHRMRFPGQSALKRHFVSFESSKKASVM